MTQYSTFIEEVPVDLRQIDGRGREVLSKERPAYPIQFSQRRPESMFDVVRRMIAQEKAKGNDDIETFEDADDFEVGDDYYDYDSRSTPYEQNFDHLAEPAAPPAEPSAVPSEPQAE